MPLWKKDFNCNLCINNETNACKECIVNPAYMNHFEPKELKDNECQCICCNKIYIDRIFRLKDKPKQGICFDCY